MNNTKELYHFCPDWMLKSIIKNGITEGKLVIQMNPPKFKACHQWLTTNPDFNQSWNELSTLPYDRTANRLKIEIPARPARYLYKWSDYGVKLAGEEMFKTLSFYGDPKNWFVFRGAIKPEWIKQVVSKPFTRIV